MQRLTFIILLMLLEGLGPPLLQAQTIESYTFTTNRVVPDGNPAGISDVRNLRSAIAAVGSVRVRLKLAGEFDGDLYGYLRHGSGFTVLLNRSGKTASDAFGSSDSGFDVTLQNAATNGDIHVYQTMITPPNGSPLRGIWQPDCRGVDPANVTDLSARSVSLTNFNGLDAGGEWTFYLADLDAGGTNMLMEWGLDIVGVAQPTLRWTNPADIIYGTALGLAQMNATAAYNAINVGGTFSYTPGIGSVLKAGPGQTLSVTFTPADTSSFLPVTTNTTINVLKAPLTITANDAAKVYRAGLPAFTASYTGFVNGDDPTSLDVPVTLETTATALSPVGTYTITADGAAGVDYAITQVNGTLTVYRLNNPPVLSQITNAIIKPDGMLRAMITGSDPDGDHLTFSLEPGAPPSAFITNVVRSYPIILTNTTVRWHPTRAYASTTNFMTVRATDDGFPPMSATQTFMVIVEDYLGLTVGSTNLESGQRAWVPIYLSSSDGVTNLAFTIEWAAAYFTNSALAITAPAIASGSLLDQLTNLLITLRTTPGQVLQGTQQIAQLSFEALSNQPSAFVPLPIQGASAVKPGGAVYSNYLADPGTVAVVEGEPLLAARLSSQSRNLILFGKLGVDYQLQSSTIQGGWSPLLNYTQTNGAMFIGVDSANPTVFYRLVQP